MARIAARQVSRVFFVPAGKNAGGLRCVYASKPSCRENRNVRLPACRAAVTCLRSRPHTRPPRRANGNRMRRRTASANIRTAAAESSAVAVRTPEPARSGDPPRSGSAAALRTGKASERMSRRLSMVWTCWNDPAAAGCGAVVRKGSVRNLCMPPAFYICFWQLYPVLHRRSSEAPAEGRLQVPVRPRRFCASSCRPASSGKLRRINPFSAA